jgi:Phage integrase family
VFLTLVLTGLRRSELQRLRWGDVDLVELVLRVRDSKSEDGIRSIALSPTLAEELWQHRRRSAFQGDGELVFCHPERGTIYRAETFKTALTAALKAAGVEKTPRPFHDLRHTAITNDAAAGSSPIAVMTKAGHANMSTTKRYLHLAGGRLPRRSGSTRTSASERRHRGRKFYRPERTWPDLGGVRRLSKPLGVVHGRLIREPALLERTARQAARPFFRTTLKANVSGSGREDPLESILLQVLPRPVAARLIVNSTFSSTRLHGIGAGARAAPP